jgi:uncharacterized protein with von Willebrand factor type A (vWA) domain
MNDVAVDWVNGHIMCRRQARRVFDHLRTSIAADIAARTKIGTEQAAPCELAIVEQAAQSFRVQRGETAIAVVLDANVIRFVDRGAVQSDVIARVELDDAGACVLLHEGGAIAEWRLREKALRRLFFGY